jgi:hypothetical protein
VHTSSLLTLLLTTATPIPSPSPTATDGSKFTYDSYGPGALGFIFTAFMVVLTIFLMRNMSKKLRRIRYNEMVREEFEGPASSSEDSAASGATTRGTEPR